MSHTPTPWKLSEEGIIAAQSATPATAGGAPNPALLRTPVIALPPVDYPDYSQFKTSDWDADAAHIVHCVNVHDQLVEALRQISEGNVMEGKAYTHADVVHEYTRIATKVLAAAEKGA